MSIFCLPAVARLGTMSRAIDRLPEPTQKFNPKVIVLSRSRVGTFSMYQAFKVLGYKPYHLYETVDKGVTHIEVVEEALNAKFRGKGKPYGKAEFDKWLANYDVIIEIPQWFVEEFVEFYPEARFILTERDLDAWIKSVDNSLGMVYKAGNTFPLSLVKRLDGHVVGPFVRLQGTFVDIIFNGKGFTDEGRAYAIRDTIEIQKTAKSLVPKEKLLACKLDAEWGWNKICPFLGIDIPDAEYPRGNAPAEFKKLVDSVMVPRIQITLVKVVSTILVPLAGIGAWYYMQRE